MNSLKLLSSKHSPFAASTERRSPGITAPVLVAAASARTHRLTAPHWRKVVTETTRTESPVERRSLWHNGWELMRVRFWGRTLFFQPERQAISDNKGVGIRILMLNI